MPTVLLTVILVMVISCQPSVDTRMVPDVTDEADDHARISMQEEAVQIRVLRGRPFSAFIVVDETIVGHFGELVDDNLRKNMPGLRADTFTDFVWKNRKPIRPISIPYEDEIAVIDRETLEKQYPNADRFPIFSRVGFSQDGRQALVYYIDSCAALAPRERIIC